MAESILAIKSKSFAIFIIKLSQYLIKIHKEFIIAKQLVRSGTAVGAMIREAAFAESKPDFIHKLHIALKEANETQYWLELLRESGLIPQELFEPRHAEVSELIKLLIASIKTAKSSIKKNS